MQVGVWFVLELCKLVGPFDVLRDMGDLVSFHLGFGEECSGPTGKTSCYTFRLSEVFSMAILVHASWGPNGAGFSRIV